MRLKRYRKAGAAALAGAVVTALAAFVEMSSEQQGGLTTVLTMLLVWAVPNA